MTSRDTSQGVSVAAVAAVDSLIAHLADPSARTTGGVAAAAASANHDELLAWAWLLRAAHDELGLEEPVDELVEEAVQAGRNDPELDEHLSLVLELLEAQAAGDADRVDAALAELTSASVRLPAVGILTAALTHTVQRAARGNTGAATEVLVRLRERAAAR